MDLDRLLRKIQDFGRTVGDTHAVVWFVKSSQMPGTTVSTADIFDVERSVHYCQAWHLKPSDSPHLVVTSDHPDESRLSSESLKEAAIFSLNNMRPTEISDLLAGITDHLILKGHVESNALRMQDGARSSAAPATEEKVTWWIKLLEATQEKLNSFGCAWSFKLETGSIKAELHSTCRNK